MLYDGLSLFEGSALSNATIASGTAYPLLPSAGELFFRTDLATLQIYTGSQWASAGGGSAVASEPDSAVYTYNLDDTVDTVTEMYGEDARVTTYSYAGDNVETVTSTFQGVTRTQTYVYDNAGRVTSMSVVTS